MCVIIYDFLKSLVISPLMMALFDLPKHVEVLIEGDFSVAMCVHCQLPP